MWIYSNSVGKATERSVKYITGEEREILDILSRNTDNSSLIIGFSNETDAMLPYLSAVYTKAWPWTSHSFTTPFIDRKKKAFSAFILNGTFDSSWYNRPCVFIFRKSDKMEIERSGELKGTTTTLSDTRSYKVLAIHILSHQ